MKLPEFLEISTDIIPLSSSGSYFQRIRSRIICKDGFSVSVQAGEYLYSSPRRNGSRFAAVELGYPSVTVKEWLDYAEQPKKPTDTIYAYVPCWLVQLILDEHGGIDVKKTSAKGWTGG